MGAMRPGNRVKTAAGGALVPERGPAPARRGLRAALGRSSRDRHVRGILSAGGCRVQPRLKLDW